MFSFSLCSPIAVKNSFPFDTITTINANNIPNGIPFFDSAPLNQNFFTFHIVYSDFASCFDALYFIIASLNNIDNVTIKKTPKRFNSQYFAINVSLPSSNPNMNVRINIEIAKCIPSFFVNMIFL